MPAQFCDGLGRVQKLVGQAGLYCAEPDGMAYDRVCIGLETGSRSKAFFKDQNIADFEVGKIAGKGRAGGTFRKAAFRIAPFVEWHSIVIGK